MRILRVLGLMAVLVGSARAQEMVVTLVGTGGPELTSRREGEATLVQADGQTLLFDAGRGVLEGLYRPRAIRIL